MAQPSKPLIEPYAQGMDASADEKTLADNPYVVGSGAHTEWNEGHAAGELDWQQFCAEQRHKKRTHDAFE